MSRPRRFQVEYRSDAALLIAYATQLVKGQLLLDSDEALPDRTPVELQLVGPAVSIPLAGEVAWTRAVAEGPAQPAGIGVALTTAADGLGEAIDKLAFDFRGLRVLVGGAAGGAPGAADPLPAVDHHLRGRRDRAEALDRSQRAPERRSDRHRSRLRGGRRLRALRAAAPAPAGGIGAVLALAQMERDRARAASLGFDEALANPPPFTELQAATLRSLAKPTRVTAI